MNDDPEVLENAVRSLSRLLLAEETLEATHSRVADLACRTLPPCDMASVTIIYDSPGGYDEAAEETALLFSDQAAVACANAEVYWRTFTLTEHLREALESRDVIGQAKGILMARRNCTPDAAFEALRRASQHRNIKLRDIAEQVVYLGDLED